LTSPGEFQTRWSTNFHKHLIFFSVPSVLCSPLFSYRPVHLHKIPVPNTNSFCCVGGCLGGVGYSYRWPLIRVDRRDGRTRAQSYSRQGLPPPRQVDFLQAISLLFSTLLLLFLDRCCMEVPACEVSCILGALLVAFLLYIPSRLQREIDLFPAAVRMNLHGRGSGEPT